MCLEYINGKWIWLLNDDCFYTESIWPLIYLVKKSFLLQSSIKFCFRIGHSRSCIRMFLRVVKFQQIDLLHVNAIKGTEPNFIAHRNITFTFFIFMCACPVVSSLRMPAYLQNFRIGVRKLLLWKVWIAKTLMKVYYIWFAAWYIYPKYI